ncbi:MAG TPA: response regulator [Bacteroidia bacterium]|nr:response regulator [Bacteroidia bacterium]
MSEQKTFRIVIMEDDEFFNDVLTHKLEQYTAILGIEKNCNFEIHSYTSAKDCLRNLKNNIDVAFVDYYLGNGITGYDIVKKIKEKCWDCKIVILSQVRNIKTTSLSLNEGAIDFILKDTNVLPKTCLILDDIVSSIQNPPSLN